MYPDSPASLPQFAAMATIAPAGGNVVYVMTFGDIPNPTAFTPDGGRLVVAYKGGPLR
jgi:hypothetical protein